MNVAVTTGETGIDTREDAYGTDAASTHKYWITEIELAKRAHSQWFNQSADLVKRYRGEKKQRGRNQMNLFWSNVSTLQPALFQKMPNPAVERRWKQRDAVSLMASTVLERGIAFMADKHDAEGHVKACRDDYLITGRGVLKVIYRAKVDEGRQPTEQEIYSAILSGQEPPQPVPPSIKSQTVRLEHVAWNDFLCSPEGVWRKKRWVAFRSRMNRKKLVARFGKKGEVVSLNQSRLSQTENENNPAAQMFQEVDVWEIWDREERKVIWITDGYTMGPLDEKDDPYGLENFFPCPKPIQVIETSTDATPVPEYTLYEDQAAEVNRLTNRIYSLSDKIRAVGAFAGQHHEKLSKILTQEDGTLVPIDNWMSMMEGRGLRNHIEWAPIREMVETLHQLQQSRDVAKQDLYEVSGISDVVRGASDAAETATAQRIKGQFATLRLDERKRLIAQMIAEACGIMGELVAEHFEAHILAAISGVEMAENQMRKQAEITRLALAGDQAAAQRMSNDPTWEDVVQLLRDDYRRSFAIRIETEDTIEVDRQADKQQRIEFLTAFVQLMQAMNAVVAGGAMTFDMAKEIIMFSVRGFSQARDLEQVLEDMQPPQQPDQGPSDAEMKMQLEQLKGQIDLLKQARDHQFQAAEGDKERAAQVAAEQIRAVEGGKERGLRAHEKAADINIQREQMATQAQQQKERSNAPVSGGNS
ncbi:hypothetical protein [Thalassobius sp. Cn5-15]|uniref:hypothetical protein n=1 Tax=Thalassobius sp. Cn5-15 TaxID=2917763 RepID=UPI001EF2DAF3|nr:hypothetical protein [Thalassobius sp. Cn5-15]MCG7492475.1 hypothetical protein [Thalassobius sp. Cn5-15]